MPSPAVQPPVNGTSSGLPVSAAPPACPAEYQLGLESAPELAAMPPPDLGSPASGLPPGEAPRPVHAWFYLTGLGALLGGILMRRL